jgi:hypothetical protein
MAQKCWTKECFEICDVSCGKRVENCFALGYNEQNFNEGFNE